jgi:hypothetical protein
MAHKLRITTQIRPVHRYGLLPGARPAIKPTRKRTRIRF